MSCRMGYTCASRRQRVMIQIARYQHAADTPGYHAYDSHATDKLSGDAYQAT